MHAPRVSPSIGRLRPLLTIAALTIGGAALAGVPRLVCERGWAPLVRLAGGGDANAAAVHLRVSAETVGVALRGLEVDAPTQAFVDGVRDSLGSFDLGSFYEMLPERRGAWRCMGVFGRREGERYRVRRAPTVDLCAISPHGPLGNALGDLTLDARVRPAARADGGENYVLSARAGLGLGPVGWPAIEGGLREGLRLIASGDPRGAREPMTRRGAPETRLRVLESHPHLRAEDVEVLSLLWEAFPSLSTALLDVGRVDDVLVFDPKGDGSYQQVRFAARLDPEALEAAGLPELAEFLAEIGPLVHADVRALDGRGRQLARVIFDSKTLRATFEAFVRDGRLCPVDAGRVITAAEPQGPGPQRIQLRAELRSQTNGIESRVSGLVADWTCTPGPDGVEIAGSLTSPPKVSVSGSAFGFLPTWAIDVLIPGNLDELLREFLGTTCAGNDGRGLELTLRVREAQGQVQVQGPPGASRGAGVVELHLVTELLDSLLVQFGMQIASQKLLPGDDARAELRTLLLRLQGAFLEDLGHFERSTRTE